MVGDGIGLDFFRPTNQEGDLQTAFIEGPFSRAKSLSGFRVEIGTEEPVRPFGSFEVVLPTVVSAHKQDGPVVDFEFLQEGENLPKLPVDHVHKGCINPGIAIGALTGLPRFILEELPRWVVLVDSPEPMRRGPGEVAKEGLFVILSDESQRLFEDLGLGVGFTFVKAGSFISLKRDLLTVSYEVLRIKGMSMDLIVVAKKVVEAVLFRNSTGPTAADAPFAKSSGGIPFRFQHLRQRRFVSPDGIEAIVTSHRSVPRVKSGEQDATGGPANGCSCIGVCESHPLACYPVDVGGEEIGMSHVPGLEISPFIKHEVDDVRLFLVTMGGRDDLGDQQENRKKPFHGVAGECSFLTPGASCVWFKPSDAHALEDSVYLAQCGDENNAKTLASLVSKRFSKRQMKRLIETIFLTLASLLVNPAFAESEIPPVAKGGEGPLIEAGQIFEIAKKPTKECHASTIVETPSGFVAAWFGGTHERHKDVGIWVSRHVEGSWTAPAEVVNGVQSQNKRFPCWNPVLFQPKEGPLLLFYKVGPSPSTWWGMLTTSHDGGRSWTWPTKLGHDKAIGHLLGPVKNKPVQLSDGAILCPSSSELDVKSGNDKWRVHFEITRDLGKTWEVIGPINDGIEFDAIQPSILTHKNGDLQILCRSRQGVVTQSWSTDVGKTWLEMTATELPNPSAGTDAVTLADGRHLLVYNHTTLKTTLPGRRMLNVAISDDGKDWRPVVTLEQTPKSVNPSRSVEYSYPAVIQAKDGKVHITYTYHREGIKHVTLDPAKL